MRYFKLGLGLFVAILAIAVGNLGLLSMQAQAAQNCDQNAVVYCGFDTKQNLIDKINNGDSNPYSRDNDLKSIFESYNISQANITNAVDGVVTKDGHVMVNGKVVADQAWSVGRQFIEGSKADGNLWMRPTATSFVSDNLPALVSLDANGKFRIAILKACGNPVMANPVAVTTTAQTFECSGLSSAPRSGVAPLAVMFGVTTQPASSTEQVSYLYDFGDGSTQDTSNRSISHTYVSNGNYTARVRLKTAAGTGDYKTVCQQAIQVAPPSTPVVPATVTPPTVSTPSVQAAPAPVQTPRTGAAGATGIAGGGIITYAVSYYRRSKRLVVEALKR